MLMAPVRVRVSLPRLSTGCAWRAFDHTRIARSGRMPGSGQHELCGRLFRALSGPHHLQHHRPQLSKQSVGEALNRLLAQSCCEVAGFTSKSLRKGGLSLRNVRSFRRRSASFRVGTDLLPTRSMSRARIPMRIACPMFLGRSLGLDGRSATSTDFPSVFTIDGVILVPNKSGRMGISLSLGSARCGEWG